jgi:hypothetical protein
VFPGSAISYATTWVVLVVRKCFTAAFSEKWDYTEFDLISSNTNTRSVSASPSRSLTYAFTSPTFAVVGWLIQNSAGVTAKSRKTTRKSHNRLEARGICTGRIINGSNFRLVDSHREQTISFRNWPWSRLVMMLSLRCRWCYQASSACSTSGMISYPGSSIYGFYLIWFRSSFSPSSRKARNSLESYCSRPRKAGANVPIAFLNPQGL